MGVQNTYKYKSRIQVNNLNSP